MEFVPDWSYGGRKLSDFSENLTKFQGVYVGEKLVALALGRSYPMEYIHLDPWRLPPGAFKKCGGPT